MNIELQNELKRRNVLNSGLQVGWLFGVVLSAIVMAILNNQSDALILVSLVILYFVGNVAWQFITGIHRDE